MSHIVPDFRDNRVLKYVITHVFCPLRLPDGDDHNIRNDHYLVRAIATAAYIYSDHVDEANVPQWHSISRMLANLLVMTQSESLDRSQTISWFGSMDVGDVLTLPIRAQNAGVIFRKQKDVTIFESFEVSPRAKDVMATQGKLICSYPGPAIEIPNLVFNDKDFLSELVNFIVHMNDDDLDSTSAKSQTGQSPIFRDTIHPRYITELLTGILRSVGRPADITRISKRVGDDAVCNNLKLRPWRRSSLWLLIRVSLQTTLDRSPLEHHTYKEFMLFFMCSLAREKTCADLSSDLLHFISAKISRRLRKLGSSAPEWLSRIVLETCTSLRSTMENRWRHVQAVQCLSPVWAPFQLDLIGDAQLSLLGSRDYLCQSLANHSQSLPNIPFNPKHRRRGTLDDFLSSDGNFFEEAYHTEPHVTLYDVERAVEQGIDSWVDRVSNNNEACEKLVILVEKYSSSALKSYANNPELLSVMLLTTIELWVVLDKIAITEIPMLADYSPEVPMSLLENLLLCQSASLRRLRHVHEYLSRRHSKSRSLWSVFSSETSENSFGIRFYEKSSHLQRLKARIEEVPRDEVRRKAIELREKNARYAMLQIREAVTNLNSPYITIGVHVWPLPANRLESELAVFELDCPVSFNTWRTATVHLLVDLCSSSEEVRPDGDSILQLSDHHILRAYLVKHPRSRISLGFRTRPHATSRFRRAIPAKREDVCFNHWIPNFFPFDTHTGLPVSQAISHSDSRRHCTYKLPSGSYHNLQRYVDSTSHTSNEVIANQGDCHKDLSVHEYMAFGHLRSGGLLQWLNILRELRARSLSFDRQEVHMLLALTVSQVGPLENTGLTWHQEIQDPVFCYALLGELQSLIRDVEASWLEGVTMDTVSFLLRRLLASSPDQAVTLETLGVLRTVRGKVFSWIQELSAELVKAPADEGLRGIMRDIAAICRSTFNVDPAMIPKVLHSAEDIEILLSSAVLIHDHTPNEVSRLSTYSQLLLDRDRRLSLALESVVSDIILTDLGDKGINLAVRRIWSDYHPGSKWRPLQLPTSRWFSCKTTPPAGHRPQRVHFNVLGGLLLVDGMPLGSCLPNEYVENVLYKLIFGDRMLKVLPGDLPGMDYMARDLISNYQVYFSLGKNNSDLVVRAKRKQTVTGDSEIIELIPQEKLKGDLPTVLIEGYAHWLNLSTSIVEIRPLDTIWEASPENWKVDCTPGYYRMWKGDEFLVDIRSQSWEMVSSLLRPLSPPQDLIISVSPAGFSQRTPQLQLSVSLPRYDLSFYVDEDGDLQSRNIRGMVYDENQSIGTLFGLVNQLVLRPKVKDVNAVELVPRCVLIPDGGISFQTDGYHIRVEIVSRHSILKPVVYQTYRVNTELGCLTGNGSLTSKLYCAYLHALTSGCSADPLTGRSGTEEALSQLRSASCWSNAGFGSRDVELLSSIASTCPSPTWYLKYSMQRVKWRNVPANSQNYAVYILAKEIKERYERVQLFHKSQSGFLFQNFPLQDDHLLMRSARRAADLFPSGFSGEPSTPNFDVRYPARDLIKIASGEHRAHSAATYVHRRFTSTIDIWETVRSWSKEMYGCTYLSLQYERSWLAPDLPLIWLEAYNLLRKSDDRKWFQLLFSLPAIAHSSSKLSELVPVFIAFASHSQFRFEDPPPYSSYPIRVGCHPSVAELRDYVVHCAYPLASSPESLEPARRGEDPRQLQQRQLGMYNRRRSSDGNAIARQLVEAWPCETPPVCSLNPDLYDVANLTFKVQTHFADRFRNLKLKEHLTRVQLILDSLHSQATLIPDTPSYSFDPSQSNPFCIQWQLLLDQLFTRSPPSLRAHDKLPHRAADVDNPSLSDSTALHRLIATVGADAENPFQSRYVSALRTSAEYFRSETPTVAQALEGAKLPATETLVKYYTGCRVTYMEALQDLQRHLGPRGYSEYAIEQSGQWPRITAHVLFQCLASNSPIVLPDDWKRCLITFTLLTLELQRARRLLLLHSDNLYEELYKELQNEGCDGWNAEAYPDWLLIQLQGNFLIRHVQAEVAHEMISPHSNDNTAMQLNMGEGKTSVIVPIIAVVLANGDQLVRVIVPKSLTTQTFHLLADRLGGLTNRRIYYLPFSRSLEINYQKVASLYQIVLECMQERGILVLQPDHILSLKLVGMEKQLPQEVNRRLAGPLLKLQRWLQSHSRDIMDEVDEILDVRSQLVFTIGRQQHIQGSPERWTTTQQILGLISKNAPSLRELFPLGVEYEPGPPGSFPYLRILKTDAGERLISWIVQDVIDGLLPNISFGHLHLQSALGEALRNFISCEDVVPAEVKLVKQYSQKTPLWSGLLLLRGLLANGILLFAFTERRWRVDYGLAPTRTMLAVPYRAKDVPAQKAEFGHPDIVIILTCLSYYYSGLSEEQLKLSFEILLTQPDPSLEYSFWVRACSAVPESLRTFSSINTKSAEQWNKSLYPLFSRNQATINFYLSSVVFPKEAKEFASKLSGSGWDLAEKKGRLLTGFSGTNDGQHLFPLHVTQRDPDHQRGTNAKVLSYLLQPENQCYMCIAHQNGERRTTREFLQALVAQKPEIRVLLDVGAQMLDMQNHELAEAWLDVNPSASAAIYFNEDDELMVLTRSGNTQFLRSSSFAQQLDRCVVYLDDAHTRGTDFKFPSGFRAAVTLGPKVTKDRLAQGCMRMRKLGRGHSIMFFAPLEIDQHIRTVAGKDKDSSGIIDTMDILHWAIRETWENIQRRAPHWVQQGMDHTSRYAAWTTFCRGQLTSKELSDKWLEPEAKTLEDLYAPRNPSHPTFLTNPDIRQRCIYLGVQSLCSVGMDEEQERELDHEVRRERQVELPPWASPAEHSIHPDVVDFVKTGVIPSQTTAFKTPTKTFKPVFKTLDATSAATDEAYVWSQSVLATTDFEQTVEVSGKIDSYLRPVHWIISAKRDSNDVLVILSPHEVNCLLPDIRLSDKIYLHLYTPCITRSTKPCDDLVLYSIPMVPDGWIPPSSLTDQLNVFAGQLYLKDYETYIRLCRFLCVYTRDLQGEREVFEVEPDGFILPKNRPRHSRTQLAHTFSSTPNTAIRVLLALRNKGIDYSLTHMGKILHGRLLSEGDFDH